jgi:hypothetical protein
MKMRLREFQVNILLIFLIIQNIKSPKIYYLLPKYFHFKYTKFNSFGQQTL